MLPKKDITYLYDNFHRFFEAYIQEENDNVFTQNFDFENKCAYILHIFFSDLLSWQVSGECDENREILFLPVMMVCSNETTNKMAFWKNNKADSILDLDALLSDFNDCNHTKDSIERLIIDRNNNFLQKMFNPEDSLSSLVDVSLCLPQEKLNQYFIQVAEKTNFLGLKALNLVDLIKSVREDNFNRKTLPEDHFKVFTYQPTSVNSSESKIWHAADYRITAILYSPYDLNLRISQKTIESVFNISMDFGSLMLFRKNELEKSKFQQKLEEVAAHRHTIRNFGFEWRLANLKKVLSKEQVNMKKALEILDGIEKLNLLRDITINFVYEVNTDSAVEKLLLYRELEQRQSFTYTEILKIINDGTTNNPCHLIIDEQTSKSKYNQVDSAKIIAIFNLFINLYSNAEKNTDNDKFCVNVLDKEDHLMIVFRNNQPMPLPVQNYLLRNQVNCPTQGQGLGIILDAVEKLPNISLSIEVNDKDTSVFLTIK